MSDRSIEVLFTLAEAAALPKRELGNTVCVVFDVLRATSTIVTALANGANAVIPVAEIPEALTWRAKHPDYLLAGERDGFRIQAKLTGGVDFDLGNSPREFTTDKIGGKTIVLSTTNGSRALRSCAKSQAVLACSFLNLQATADFVKDKPEVLIVCSGTHNEASYEDVLGAGALVELLWPGFSTCKVADSAKMALEVYQHNSRDLLDTMKKARNGARLLSTPELRDDVAWCLKRDSFPLLARMQGDAIRKA